MKKKYNILHILLFLVFLSSSFDIFLSINIFGFTIRICQLISMILMVYSLYKIIKENKIIKPLGIVSFALWGVFLVASTFNTVLLKINIAYDLWLIFNFIFIISMVNIFKEDVDVKKIVELYVLSFTIIAVFGLFQFILPFIGINPPFVTQWWVNGKIARINGLCYEPSYFSTYLLMGWIILRILLKYVNKYFKDEKKLIITSFTIISLAMVLSSSRIGIIMIVLYEVCDFVYDFVMNKKDKKNNIKFLVILIIFLIVLGASLYFISKYVYNLKFLLNGTGLFGTSSHSFSDRFRGMIDTFIVFTKSPLIGRGLGGVYTYVAMLNGFDIFKNSVQDVGIVQNVFVEVLAASGIFGFIFFIKYLYELISKPLKLAATKIKNNRKKIIMISFVIALIFELIILMFNQNILRPYLWIHITLICLIYEIYRGKYEKK